MSPGEGDRSRRRRAGEFLRAAVAGGRRLGVRRRIRPGPHAGRRNRAARSQGCVTACHIPVGAHLGAMKLYRERPDRKSVVSGKSVSVRVDLGGRSIIKKKNKLTIRITSTLSRA